MLILAVTEYQSETGGPWVAFSRVPECFATGTTKAHALENLNSALVRDYGLKSFTVVCS